MHFSRADIVAGVVIEVLPDDFLHVGARRKLAENWSICRTFSKITHSLLYIIAVYRKVKLLFWKFQNKLLII